MSPTTRETADARVWSRRVTTRQDRHNNLCHQPPPRKDRASLRRRQRTRISTFRAKITRPRVIPRSLIAYLAYTIGQYSLCTTCLFLPCSRFSHTAIFRPISSHSACSSSSQLAALSLSTNILGVLVIDLMRHSHVYFLRVLEFCTTGGVLAITPYSRRARYLMSNVGVLDYSISPSTAATSVSLV